VRRGFVLSHWPANERAPFAFDPNFPKNNRPKFALSFVSFPLQKRLRLRKNELDKKTILFFEVTFTSGGDTQLDLPRVLILVKFLKCTKIG
jgi:hypothetical protein